MDSNDEKQYRDDLARSFAADLVDNLVSLLEPLHERHIAGDPRAVWEALFLCFDFHTPAPRWVRLAFREGFGRYMTAESGSLGEAFGLQRPKSWHSEPMRTRLAPDEFGRTRVFRVATAMHEQIAARTKVAFAFEPVAAELGLTVSEVKDIWYSLPHDLRKPRR